MSLGTGKTFQHKKPLVSVCMLTIDRYAMTKYVLNELLSKAGINREDIQLLILDNGSSDKRTIELGRNYADIHIEKPFNIGVSKGFNELFRQAKGDFICTVGNDIGVGENWLKDLISYQRSVKKSGISAIYCLMDKGVYNPILDVWVPKINLVYGIALWSANLLKSIGGFDESLSGYGCEDSQYCYRSFLTGHLNYYIPNQHSQHLGEDFNSQSQYRMEKNKNLALNQMKLKSTLERMIFHKNFKVSL